MRCALFAVVSDRHHRQLLFAAGRLDRDDVAGAPSEQRAGERRHERDGVRCRLGLVDADDPDVANVAAGSRRADARAEADLRAIGGLAIRCSSSVRRAACAWASGAFAPDGAPASSATSSSRRARSPRGVT